MAASSQMVENAVGKEIVHYEQFYFPTVINSLPDNKILDWSKLKQIADNILKCI